MFQFMTSTRIVFGEGALQSSLSVLNHYGYSVLLVTGQDIDRAKPVLNYIKHQNMRYQHMAVTGEPNITMIEETALIGRKFKPDMVVSIGGGSVIDVGKALAAIIPNQGDVYDYVEVVGRNVPLKSKPIPFIAIPTTACTGSEVTRNAVLRSGQDKVKVSLRSPEMLADVAIIDPELTYGTEKAISARGAMKAFVHLMEAYVCGDPNPLTDMICEEGLRRLRDSIIPGCLQDEPQARSDLAFAAMLGGMASNNAKLGAAHGLASALGGKLDAPNSIITARLAPFVMTENINAAREANKTEVLNRYAKVAQILSGRVNACRDDSVLWVNMMLDKLDLPTLDSFGLCQTSFDEVAHDALKSIAIKGNPLPLTTERLVYILEQVCPNQASCVATSYHEQSSVKIMSQGDKKDQGSLQDG